MQTECPHCGNDFDIVDRLVGRRVRCPRCGERFRAGAREAKSSTGEEKRAQGARSVGHFLTRDLGIVISGVVVVGIILGALVFKMWWDHQGRAQQETLAREAWANKDAGDQFRSRQEYAKALEKYVEAQDRLDRLDVPDRKLQRELEAVLQTDEMKYLARGMVQFRGQWVPEKEKDASLAQEQGLIEFDGRWVKPEEKAHLETEKEKAEAAARLSEEKTSVRPEAEARGREVVDAFLRYAKEKAPAEAAERYMSPLTGDPLDVPPIVLDYAIDAEATSVAQDPERKQPAVSATYAAVKAYLTTFTARGQERVVWNFQVRKVDNEWKITYSKQREVSPPSAPSAPAAGEGQPAAQ